MLKLTQRITSKLFYRFKLQNGDVHTHTQKKTNKNQTKLFESRLNLRKSFSSCLNKKRCFLGSGWFRHIPFFKSHPQRKYTYVPLCSGQRKLNIHPVFNKTRCRSIIQLWFSLSWKLQWSWLFPSLFIFQTYYPEGILLAFSLLVRFGI